MFNKFKKYKIQLKYKINNKKMMRIKDIKKMNKIMMIKFYILQMKEKNEHSYINI